MLTDKQNLQKKVKCILVLTLCIAAIRWAHRLADLADPCKSDLVETIREGAIRSVGRCVVKKEPITPEILRQLVNVYGFHNNRS
jgi:hypothetical protein